MSLDQALLSSLCVGLVLAAIVWWASKSFWFSVLAAFGSLALGLVIFWPRPETEKRPVATKPDPLPAEQVQQVAATLSEFDSFRPAEVPDGGYVSSETCAECHADQHHSWHRSYHRTMTQTATPDAVIGDFDNMEVMARGRKYSLERAGDVCWVKMNDPDYPVSPQTAIDVPIVMTTGSHHMQFYWYPMGDGRTLGQLPLVYLKETEQWIPRTAANLRPSDSPIDSEMGRWNRDCSQCHSTHARARKRDGLAYDTYVTEFGISCEACHGPAAQHIAMHRAGKVDVVDDPIVNPKDLSNHASAQVCGQCHSVRQHREEARLVHERGHSFRPGKDLNDTHEIWQRDSEAVRNFLQKIAIPEEHEKKLRSVFWDDGMVRIAGREFNSMLDTTCFVRGEMSCLSCHAMHQDESDERELGEWANDQLSADALGDTACTNCHTASQYGSNHTHHPGDSSGSRCYNCHMPHTSYGLMRAIRSHTIVSPNIGRDMDARRPNACNLCHLDKTLQWSANKLHDWYESPVPEFTEEQTTVAASVLWLLKGDAGLRALSAWNMGWAEAQEASGKDWIAPLMARTLNDPYAPVRFIARRSLRTLPQFGDFEFDAVADENERVRRMEAAIRQWEERDKDHDANLHILLDANGSQTDRIEQLMNQRDNTEIDLAE